MKMIDGKLHRYTYLLVYGCQMNQSDAERMMGQLRTIGYERTESMEEADLILINTCCVRETAEDRVYGKIGEIKRLKRENPELIFGITGCMAQKEGDALIKRAPHIDFVLGTNKVHELTHVVQEIQAEHGHVVDVQLGETELPDDVPVARAGSLSAWVPIMYGCNNFCTYCIVPYVRGRERSRLPEDIVHEVEEAVKKYAIVEHPEFGKVYAFEVDGYGSRVFMDDANVPSLLALPFLGCVDVNDPVYQNTRRLVLSPSNPYFFKGKAGEGIGGPHIGVEMIWPMSIMMRAFTSTDDEEIRDCIIALMTTDAGTGFMHESFSRHDAADYTRAWFAWQNTLFGELILKLVNEGKTDLLNSIN